jgi:hypothetical protein
MSITEEELSELKGIFKQYEAEIQWKNCKRISKQQHPLQRFKTQA